MKKLILILLILSCSLFGQYENGSFDKGLTYYKFLFKNELKYDGSVFTAKYTAKEWEELFSNNAEGFKKEFLGITPKLDSLLNSKKFEKIAPHIKAFAIHYSKDSGYSPHCGNDDIDDE
jgi:hypothetical protein